MSNVAASNVTPPTQPAQAPLPPLHEMARAYLTLSERIDAQNRQLDEWKGKREIIANFILQGLQQGQQDKGTFHGYTFSPMVKTTCVVEDAEKFLKVVAEHGFDLMDVRANMNGVVAFLQEHNHLPDGVKTNQRTTLSCRKA